MSITEKQLNEIQGRLDAATNGPWTVSGEPLFSGYPEGERAEAVLLKDGSPITWDDHGGEVFNPDDAELIANAPADLADLLAEVHRLRDELAKAREVTESKMEAAAHEIDSWLSDDGVTSVDFPWDVAHAVLTAVLGGGDDA